MGQTMIYVVIGISLIINVFVLVIFLRSQDGTNVMGDEELRAEMMLVSRSLFKIKGEMEEIKNQLSEMHLEKKVEKKISPEDDLISLYRKGMSVEDIAKQTNKSVHEVDLLLWKKGRN